MNKLPWILPAGLVMGLGLSALGFQYFAVRAFDVGTDHAYVPHLKSNPAPAKCVKQR